MYSETGQPEEDPTTTGDPVPDVLEMWPEPFRDAFTAPTWRFVLILVMGALLAPGKRTVEQCRQAEAGQRLEPGMLDTDRAPVAVGDGIDINALPVPLRARAVPVAIFPALDQQGGKSPGFDLDPRIGIAEVEGGLSGELIGDAPAQARPVRAPDREVAPEIEKGTLADPVPLAAVLDQAKGDVVAAVAGGACLGLSNEHGSAMADGASRRKASSEKHGTTAGF